MKQPLSKLPWLSSATTSMWVSDGQWGTWAHGRCRTGGGGRVTNSQWWNAMVWRSLSSMIRNPAVLHTTDLWKTLLYKAANWWYSKVCVSSQANNQNYNMSKSNYAPEFSLSGDFILRNRPIRIGCLAQFALQSGEHCRTTFIYMADSEPGMCQMWKISVIWVIYAWRYITIWG